ncbi:hypothetical protein CROQUDRAFT_88756 [Cronartium quercuum f. sp. fusiforme G11]|uniref:Uncharacterized protein n=1 Tax=Cronartium quercuum f. sp. fusiforme G11 TaxID=708437 RepID=A0A9P6TEL7_9BASI|nr:hypothetical protein CROQUDRAFT_88756 [Cronartium quercuum f. sp. fusiforme G11]
MDWSVGSSLIQLAPQASLTKFLTSRKAFQSSETPFQAEAKNGLKIDFTHLNIYLTHPKTNPNPDLTHPKTNLTHSKTNLKTTLTHLKIDPIQHNKPIESLTVEEFSNPHITQSLYFT